MSDERELTPAELPECRPFIGAEELEGVDTETRDAPVNGRYDRTYDGVTAGPNSGNPDLI